MSGRARKQTFECPHCGAEVVVGKRVCRECGSDAVTGWQDQDEIDYQSIDIPDGYGPEEQSTQVGDGKRTWLFAAVAILVAVALLLLTILSRG